MRDWFGSCLWTRLYFIFLVNSLAGSGNWFLKLIKLRENYAGIKWAENSSRGLPNILLKFGPGKKAIFSSLEAKKNNLRFKEIEINVDIIDKFWKKLAKTKIKSLQKNTKTWKHNILIFLRLRLHLDKSCYELLRIFQPKTYLQTSCLTFLCIGSSIYQICSLFFSSEIRPITIVHSTWIYRHEIWVVYIV